MRYLCSELLGSGSKGVRTSHPAMDNNTIAIALQHHRNNRKRWAAMSVLSVDRLERMNIEDIRMNAAPLLGIVKVDPDIVKDRRDRHALLEQKRFRLLENREALLFVNRPVGVVDQPVVLGVLPTTPVVTVVRHEHVEEGIRIVVVAHPA